MIHHVFATKSNIGDWMSAKGIQHLLSPYQIVESFCDDPFVADTIGRLSRLSSSDLIVIGGGGLFMDYFSPFWEGFAAIAERVPFCIWGVGYCDLKHVESRPPTELLRRIVRVSQLCIVRDDLTRDYLAGLNIPAAVQCPAMTVLEPPTEAGFGVLHADHFNVIGSEAYEVVHAVALRFAQETGRGYQQTDNQISDGDERALSEQLDRYARADVLVTSRLHGCIIGLAMGRKVLAISGDRKVDSFMRAAGLSEWVCDVSDLGGLSHRLARIEEQRWPREFVQRVRAENQVVADAVKNIAHRLETGLGPDPNRQTVVGAQSNSSRLP